MSIELEIPGITDVVEMRFQIEGLAEDFRGLGDAITDAFNGGGATTLERKISNLCASFTRLKNAVAEAFAPVANVLLPTLSSALNAVTRFVSTVGDVMAGLFGQVRKESKETVHAGGAALKRYLADFDEIQRIGSASGGSSTTTVVREILPEELPLRIQKIVDEILRFLKPLQEIDFSAARKAFADLKAAVEPISRALFSGLEWVWFNILCPIGEWSAEQFLPAFLETLSAAFGALDEVVQAAKPALQWLWEEVLAPMAQWAADNMVEGLQWLREKLEKLGDWVRQNQEPIGQFIRQVGELALKIGAVKLAVELLEAITGGEFGGLGGFAMGVLGMISSFERLKEGIEDTKESARSFIDGLNPVLKNALEAMGRAVNGLIAAVEGGINGIVKGINGLTFQFPYWVPEVGGTTWHPTIPTVSLPRIPGLAKGAVLPANKPFLAVVGDQTHGTNVEAPLEVIQQAVAQVMGENLATQDRTVELLTQILGAIGAIRVGDEVIGQAARRYEQRMAMMGGY